MQFMKHLILCPCRVRKETLLKVQRWTNVTISFRGVVTPPGKFVDVDGYKIHYEQLGHGDHVVFFMPGAVGSTRVDFGELERMDPDKFTVIAWDPPGYAFSRPPDRTFPLRYLHRDAQVAQKLIKTLGISTLSVVGWCNGASTAIIFAGQNQHLMNKLVAVSGIGVLKKSDVVWLEKNRDIMTWSESMREACSEIYGLEYLKSTWAGCLDALKALCEKNNGDICATEAQMIKCPTLLVHATLDSGVQEYHFKMLKELIPHAQTMEIEGVDHFFPVQAPDIFYNVVQSFLLQ